MATNTALDDTADVQARPAARAVVEHRVTAATLSWENRALVRAGKPHQVLAGSMHYFRVHPAQWRDRMLRLRDLGLNTVDTYIAWNFHQSAPGEAADFSGWRDIEAFLAVAADAGMDAIVRPGPYICAEWSNGGLPTWLTAHVRPLRTSDPAFLDPVRRWFDQLIPRLVPLQAGNGGPIVAVQVENEFGSYGDDRSYPARIAQLLRASGITEMMYTADGPTELMLDGGAVDGLLAALTLGSRVGAARQLARERRPDEPFFVAEYWNGWFDHWGHPHQVRAAESAASALSDIVADAGSVSVYMAHGGSNFGLWAGANRVDGTLRATVTSYDSDAPIAEDGRLTDKFFALRDVLGAQGAPISAQPRLLGPRTLDMRHGAPLATAVELLADAAQSVGSTSTFEQSGIDAGLMLYRADVQLPGENTELVFEGIADRAQVYLDGVRIGTVRERDSLPVTGGRRRARLDVVVENLGRVNYGPRLGEHKGMTGAVLLGRRMIQRWQARPLRIDAIRPEDFAPLLGTDASPRAEAGVSHAGFVLEDVLDTHLRLPGFVKGFVWVNGFLLGRYWDVGPQQTMYVPAPLLHAGENDIVVLELERRGTAIELCDRADLGPEEHYIQEF